MLESTEKPRLLFVSERVPIPNSGEGAYPYDLLKTLEAHFSLTLCTPKIRDIKRYPVIKNRPPHEDYWKIGAYQVSLRGILYYCLRKVFRWIPSPATGQYRHPTPAFHNQVRSLSRKKWDVVIANYWWLAPMLGYFSKKTHKCVLTHDVAHEHYCVGKIDEDPMVRDMNPEFEAGMLNYADTIIAITEYDKRKFQEMLPSKRVITAPISCEVSTVSVPRDNKKVVVGFFATSFFPNLDGINWFIEQCWPNVRSEFADIELQISGFICKEPEKISEAAGVTLMGPVDQVSDAFKDVDIFIIPLLFGSGLKIKLVEAVAHGCPVVTTPAGAQGVEFLSEFGVRICDNANDFAHAVIEIAAQFEMRKKMHNANLVAARRYFSRNAAHGALIQTLSSAQCHEPEKSIQPLRNLPD